MAVQSEAVYIRARERARALPHDHLRGLPMLYTSKPMAVMAATSNTLRTGAPLRAASQHTFVNFCHVRHDKS
jgi:hypothetical protein